MWTQGARPAPYNLVAIVEFDQHTRAVLLAVPCIFPSPIIILLIAGQRIQHVLRIVRDLVTEARIFFRPNLDLI